MTNIILNNHVNRSAYNVLHEDDKVGGREEMEVSWGQDVEAES